MDDGSKDSTVDVAKKYVTQYPQYIKILKLKRNQGKGAAIKVGVKEALGRYVLMVIHYPTISIHTSFIQNTFDI